MQYSASQYRRVQHQFLQQFELKTLQFYEQNVNSNNLIEYKKILNDLTTRRRQTISKKQNYKWRRKRETSYDNISQQKRTVYLPQNKQSVEEDNEAEVGFYITQNFCLKSRTQEIVSKQSNSNDYKQNRVDSMFTKSKVDPVNNMNSDENNNNLDMDQLKDRIYGQYSVSQCLKHQQSQVQEAIFCFKKRIMALQQNVNTQDIKSKQVDRLLVQNNNQMLRAKHTNQQVRSAFLKTKKHFQLDLQGRRQIQQKFNEKNKEEFEQSIINHIYIKNMKQHIAQQQAKLHKLDTIRHELEKKEKKYKSIYTKEQELYKVYDEILKIDPEQIVKRPIVSILDKEFQQSEKAKTVNMSRQKLRECGKLFSRTKTHFKDNSIAEASKKKLSAVVKEIIELYRQMKHQQASRISEFKLLINQRDQKQSQYNKTLLKLAEIHRTLFQQLPLINPQSKLLLQTLQQQISLISARTNSINNSSNGLEYRLKFYLSKQLTIMKKVIQNWLKSDKIAGKWIQAVLEKFSLAGVFIGSNSRGSCRAPYQQQIQERQLSSDDSRNLLISCFQNWQEYLPYLDILHESSFIYRFMSKNKLFKLFKRIIKTKIANRQIPTQDIFQKALQSTFQQGRCLHISRIKNLLNVFKDLYIYLNKILSNQLPLQCSFNYSVPIQTQQPESNELSKLPSRNELQRISTKNTNPDRNSMGTKNEGNSGQKVQFNSLLTESKKINFVSSSGAPKMKDQDIISKLKKRKHLKSILNIHQFYEDLRQEIEKVNKISAF